ncbi:MMPL family transporter [Paractinoplanes ferrugineus]|uniref:Membrane protein n=1 Tax=Paractinoplanes ferrugineus TaxID=113564 RepID=A0A919IYF1_9ACTN|nr:MMPL family transporter [Actinoplanes ferrugineus]GIE10508.1 membrane protein [Actinoplanes ferrugineus]
MAALLARIGAVSARRRWWVLGAWTLVLVVAVGLAVHFGKPLDSKLTVTGLPSTRTLEKVDREFGGGGDEGKVVVAAPAGAALGGYRAALTDLGAALGAEPVLSPGGRIAYLTVATATGSPARAAALERARGAGLQVEESSEPAPPPEGGSSAGVGLVIALVVLLITFGSLSAAGLPLLTAVLGLGVSLAGLYAVTALVPVNSVAPTLAILLGLAVGIDYALFLIDRHRRQLADGTDVRESIALATGTAGSAVLFAAVTVIIALAGLAVARVGFLTQMGLAAAGAVSVAVLMALTLTPALLSLAGRRVLGRRRLPSFSVSPHWAAAVTRHSGAAVVLSVLLLGVLSVPVLGIRLGLPDDGDDPSTATDRRAYDLIADGFGAGANGPLLVLARVDATAGPAAIEARLAATPGVARVLPAGVRGGDALLTVVPSSGPADAATATLVAKLRRQPGLLVTGPTAVAIDISDHLARALPLYLALVAGFAFVLLVLVFRSVLIAAKAVLSFLLSLGAALGCTVAVFQWGWFGLADPAGPLLGFLPTIVIGVLFGLSMDYEMFLVSGMHEEHRRGAAQPVVSGFTRGAKVVVAAALIMIGVFGGGVLGGSPVTRPIAFALAVGVLADAFVVRLVLVPAAIALFGRAAWWLPRGLDRLLPAVEFSAAGR